MPTAPQVIITSDLTANGKYVFTTGRRKTAIANVRMLEGIKEHQVNRKPLTTYFPKMLVEKALEPFRIAGMDGQYYIYATINGGGINAQSEALRHGIAQAIGLLSEDVRKIMKKNGFLTRDDRKKERKKPGLKGARRSPQWAKR